MKLPGRIPSRGRTARRVLILSSMTFLLAVVFGVSLVVAQGQEFMPWSAHTNGSDDLASLRNKMRAVVVGQSAIGITESDDYQVELGFHTGVRAGPEAFASLAADIALTPTAAPTETPEPAVTETPTAEPTEEAAVPTEEPAVPTETPEAAATATPTMVPTVKVQRPSATATRRPSPSATSVPPPVATREPIVIVVTSPPRPSPTSEPLPAVTVAPPTPLVIVVTSVPPTVPAVPDSPVGGLCSAPGSYGPLPLDLGLLMILAAPIALWKFRTRP